MKHIALLLLVMLPIFIAACLDFSQDVSGRFPELEARAALELEIRKLCDHKKSKIPNILDAIDEATAEAKKEYWLITVDGADALVFPSRIVTGSYLTSVKNDKCR